MEKNNPLDLQEIWKHVLITFNKTFSADKKKCTERIGKSYIEYYETQDCYPLGKKVKPGI